MAEPHSCHAAQRITSAPRIWSRECNRYIEAMRLSFGPRAQGARLFRRTPFAEAVPRLARVYGVGVAEPDPLVPPPLAWQLEQNDWLWHCMHRVEPLALTVAGWSSSQFG